MRETVKGTGETVRDTGDIVKGTGETVNRTEEIVRDTGDRQGQGKHGRDRQKGRERPSGTIFETLQKYIVTGGFEPSTNSLESVL